MNPDPRINAIAASNISSAAILASLVGTLAAKGVLSAKEVREIYEQALVMLGRVQIEDAEMRAIYDEAKAVIKEQLEP